MDWSRFRLDRRPFRASIDVDSYFPSPSHEEALAVIAAGFSRRDPVVLIDGPSGIGKSLVARKWLEHLVPDVPRVVLPSVRAETPSELLQAMLFDWGKPYRGLTEQELRLAVTECLLEASASGYPTVLVLDEAQYLGRSALEELRLLGNLETRHGATLFVLLVSHPMLREALHRPAYELFAQRVACRSALVSLSNTESVEYIRHQIRSAGGDAREILDTEAVEIIASACEGIPRVINRVASLALTLAWESGAERIEVEAVLEALERLEMEAPESDKSGESEEPVLLPHPGRPAESVAAEGALGRGTKDKMSRKRTA
jgi:type II secretory pathway predicted ATPase ExeA